MLFQTASAASLAVALLSPPVQHSTYNGQKARKHFVTITYDWQYMHPLSFNHHPLEDLLGQPVREVHLETFDYRTEDGSTTVDVQEFSHRNNAIGATIYPFGSSEGTTLAIRARRELIELARRYRVPIVEDETYCELSLGPEPPPALNELDEDGTVVIRVNSFSKVLAPGLRLGWIGAARPIVDQLALMKQQVDPHTQNLVQLVVSRLIQGGMFDRHLLALRGEHRRRRDAVVKALQKHTPTGALRFSVPEGGLFLWCRLAGDVSARDVQERALTDSVFIVTGEPFYVDGDGARELRICFTTKPPEIAAQAARVIATSVIDATRQATRAEPISRIV